MTQELNYETAYNELKEIVSDIENENISIDVLSEKVKRASFLISFCQSKLRATENEVTNILKQMEARVTPE